MAVEQAVNFNPVSSTDIPFLYLPDTGSLFLDRAQRLHQLVSGHALADYLGFMATVAMAQHQALAAFPAPALPPASPDQPPLAPSSTPLDTAWQTALKTIIDKTAPGAPHELASSMRRLAAATARDIDQLAQAYLAGEFGQDSLALMPIVGAGLQVYWTALTQQLQLADRLPTHAGTAANLCPTCGSLPVGSVVRAGASHQGLRYLACSLCPTQWHMERIHCVHCGDSAKVFYYFIESQNEAVQAETCDACHTYTKIMHMEKNPALDVIADDLATVALDMLVNDAGYQRYGLNPGLLTIS